MAIVPSGALNANTTTNFYYPYVPQTLLVTLSGVQNATFSGTVPVATVTGTGWSSVNNAGFVFQTGQYNSKREGSGN